MSNTTHHNGQVRTECPDCGHKIRLRAVGDNFDPTTHVRCGSCENGFHADRETGEVVDSA